MVILSYYWLIYHIYSDVSGYLAAVLDEYSVSAFRVSDPQNIRVLWNIIIAING